MRSPPHLSAGIISILLLCAGTLVFDVYVGSLENRYVNALAPLGLIQTINGIALQQAAVQRPDLLLVYGSSDVMMADTPYNAKHFFATYPTGFTVFQVANLGTSSLNIAQYIAAIDSDLHGKKIVISVSPANFFIGNFYGKNFSPICANKLIFSTHLSMRLKIDTARRMNHYEDTLQNDPLLRFAIVQLTGTSMTNRVLYVLSWPLGELHILIMRFQEHAEIMFYLQSHPVDPDVKKIPQKIDWSTTLAGALADQKGHTGSNPFGIEDDHWAKYQYLMNNSVPAGSGDADFIRLIKTYPEWGDLDILQRVLQERGAQPLILSRPMNVHLWEAMGVSEQAQNSYYAKLHKTINQQFSLLVDLHQYGRDIYFSTDQYSHTSREGWVYIDQILDAFYHGQLHP